MPTKRVRYRGVRFDAAALQAALKAFTEEALPVYRASAFEGDLRARHKQNLEGSFATPDEIPIPDDLIATSDMTIETGDTRWTFDARSEFYAALRQPYDEAHITVGIGLNHRQIYGTPQEWTYYWEMQVHIDDRGSTVEVTTGGRNRVEGIMGLFDEAVDRCTLPVVEVPAKRPRVFIGHGHSEQWRLLAEHLRDVHHYEVEAFEFGSRAGHTVRDILEGILSSADIALLVMTGEDAQKDGEVRARQNVVHEAGLFQGRLGFSRGVILLEEGTEPFSNVDGIQYIGFSVNNIRETFGDVLGLLRREFDF